MTAEVLVVDDSAPVRQAVGITPWGACKFVPIITLTRVSGEAMMREGQAAGARAWVVEPGRPAQMLSAVLHVPLAARTAAERAEEFSSCAARPRSSRTSFGRRV
ncbi:hypothetical protein JCM9957A_03100 [Kineosporia succinea]|nr:hypothetical protein [Kineosporia succinea]